MAGAAGRALLRSMASRIARAPPQQHQRLVLRGLHCCHSRLWRPYISSSTLPPTNMARTYVRALQSGGIKVQQDSLYSKEIAWVIVAASEIVLWIVKAIPKVLLFAVVYHIWGKPVARDIKAIRRLLEEQRRDSAKR